MVISMSMSTCSFSDILSNETSCLPDTKEGGTFIPLPPFQLQLHLVSDTIDINVVNEGVRYVLEYYLNYTLSQFDETADFDNGGFAYATVDDVTSTKSDTQLQKAIMWQFSVSAGAYYNLSPGGWIFSSFPGSKELLSRVENVIKEPLGGDQIGTKFGMVLALLFENNGLKVFEEVVNVGIVSLEDTDGDSEDVVGIPTLEPSVQSTSVDSTTTHTTDESTNKPTKYPVTIDPSPEPSVQSTSVPTVVPTNEPTDKPTKRPTTIAPSPSPSMLQTLTNKPPIASTKAETEQPTLRVTDIPTQWVPETYPTPWPFEIDTVQTFPPVANDETMQTHSSMFPTITFDDDEDELLDKDEKGKSENDTFIYSNSSSTRKENEFDKASLGPTSFTDNPSKVIASATLIGSFLLLLIVSGAFFITKQGSGRRSDKKEDKNRPLHVLSDDWEYDMENQDDDVKSPDENADGDITEFTRRKSQENDLMQNDMSLNESGGTSAKFDDLISQRKHSPLSPASSSYDDPDFVIGKQVEEDIAKGEMVRELFLEDEESLGLGIYHRSSSNADDDGTDKTPQHSPILEEISQKSLNLGLFNQSVDNEDAKSNRSLEYSASDAPIHNMAHQNNTEPLNIAFNIISPTSVQDRTRLRYEGRGSHLDPPEHDATVVTDDGSLGTFNDDITSHSFPEMDSSWNDLTSGLCDNTKSSWRKCITDCAPASIKDLVLPMRNGEDKSYEANEIIAYDDNWCSDALCDMRTDLFRDDDLHNNIEKGDNDGDAVKDITRLDI